jgi:hypothetical protein
MEEVARERQHQRFESMEFQCNVDMHPAQVQYYCLLDYTCQARL